MEAQAVADRIYKEHSNPATMMAVKARGNESFQLLLNSCFIRLMSRSMII